ncbi:MAG: hypothetical protein IKS41_04975 [Alphaproteobacteria bacterium]|nr:hypothetical protein [Alphaproteobacteria bacterium]
MPQKNKKIKKIHPILKWALLGLIIAIVVLGLLTFKKECQQIIGPSTGNAQCMSDTLIEGTSHVDCRKSINCQISIYGIYVGDYIFKE